MLRRREFLKGAATLAAAGISRAKPARGPNLLFIFASGWRAQTMATSGESDLHAPNLERLAKSGAQFDRLYASDPSGAPAQAALITGRFPFPSGVTRDGVHMPIDQPSIAQQLKQAGYQTGFIGEWRLEGTRAPALVPPGPRRRGFDYWTASNETGRQTDLAADFIKQNRQSPFYLFVSWGPAQSRRTPATQTSGGYNRELFHLRPNIPEGYRAQARTGYARYYSYCTALDGNIGRLLSELDRYDLANDTVVAFTSDHGEMLGSQGLEGSDLPFEESVRVPLIVRYPRAIKPGSKNDSLISNIDLMPTLLRMCGVEVPEEVQGQDFSSAFSGANARRRESVYSLGKLNTEDEWRMVVRGLDKLVVDRDLNVTHLYNLGPDPFEMDNLAQEPSQDLKRDELKALLKDWMRRSGDGMDPSGLRKRSR